MNESTEGGHNSTESGDRARTVVVSVAYLALCLASAVLLRFGEGDLRVPEPVNLLGFQMRVRPIATAAVVLPVAIFLVIGLLALLDSQTTGRRPPGYITALAALISAPFAAVTVGFGLIVATEWGAEPGRTLYQELAPNTVLAFPTSLPIFIYCSYAFLSRWDPRTKSFQKRHSWLRLFMVGAVPGVMICLYAAAVLYSAP